MPVILQGLKPENIFMNCVGMLGFSLKCVWSNYNVLLPMLRVMTTDTVPDTFTNHSRLDLQTKQEKRCFITLKPADLFW